MAYTQTELGRLVGKTQGYISMVCRGKRTPSWATALALAEHTGISTDDWQGFNKEKIMEVVECRETEDN